MSIYDELQAVTKGIMTEFKQGSVNYVRMAPGSGGTPDAPAAATATPTALDAAVRGVAKAYVDRGLAVATDRQVVSSVVVGLTPSMTDFIDVDGVRHKIVHIDPRPSAGVAVAWIFIIRR